MKQPPAKTRLSDLKGSGPPASYAPPTPRVGKRKPGKTLSAEEKAAFLASRPDLAPPKG